MTALNAQIRNGFRTAVMQTGFVFSVVTFIALILTGCQAKNQSIDIKSKYSKNTAIYKFCDALNKSILKSSNDVFNYQSQDKNTDLSKKTTFLNLEKIMSNLDVSFRYLDWKIVDELDREEAFILTLPLNEKYYNSEGVVSGVSITTVEKYIDQFEEKSKNIIYVKSKIGETGYVFLRKINQSKYNEFEQISNLFSKDSVSSLRSLGHYQAPIYIEFLGLQFDIQANAEMIIVFEDHILFLDAFHNIDEDNFNLRVRLFDPSLKPGEEIFLYDYLPQEQRGASGPLRHVDDSGCNFTVSNHNFNVDLQEK